MSSKPLGKPSEGTKVPGKSGTGTTMNPAKKPVTPPPASKPAPAPMKPKTGK